MKLNYRNERNALAVASFWGKPISKPDWYSINALNDGDSAEIFIFDVIGWPYNDAGDLVKQMAGMKDKKLLVRINSPGGDCFDGLSIFNALANHPGGVTTRIEGMAASMASIIAMAGKNIEAYSNTMVMIHNALVYTAGNHHELRSVADIAEKISGQMAGIYSGRTKNGKRDVQQMMDAETYMTAKEAKEKGFIDTILQTGQGAKAEFDLPFATVPDFFKGTDELTERDAEKALREAGFSRRQAKAMLAGRLREDGEDTPTEPPAKDPEDFTACTVAAQKIIQTLQRK